MRDSPQGTQRTQRLNKTSGEIIHAAMEVHSALGLLINFNTVHLRDGIKRMVNHL